MGTLSFKRQTSTVGTKPKISFAGLQVGSYLPERGRGCNLIHPPDSQNGSFI